VWDEGKDKCNKFVYDMVKSKAKADFPERKFLGVFDRGQPVSAGNLGNKNKTLEYTKIINKENAIIGDIVGYKRDDFETASGHTVIHVGNLKIKKNGKVVEDESGYVGSATIGASSDKVRYRTYKYLESKEYKNPVFRRIISKKPITYGKDHYGPAYAAP
jgi:hypothetical protein